MLNKRDLYSIRGVVREEVAVGVENVRTEFCEVIAESILPKFDEIYVKFDEVHVKLGELNDKIDKVDGKVEALASNTVRTSQFNIAMDDLRRKRKPRQT